MNPSYGLIHQAEVDLILKWLTIETGISPGVANLSFLKKSGKPCASFCKQENLVLLSLIK